MKQPYDFESQALALVGRMSVDEKASLMSGSSFWHLQPLADYDLPPIMVSDGPHGLRKQGNQADHMGLTASEIGRAHVRTPVTEKSRMPSSA